MRGGAERHVGAGSLPTLVGRETEQELLARWRVDLSGGATTWLLQGAAGVGKTAVWEYGVRWLADSTAVLTSRPDELGHGLSYSALADLMHGLEGEIDDLRRVEREALRQALRRGPAAATGLDHSVVALAASDVLRLLATGRGVVLAIDDLQWLDPASARVIGFALRRLVEMPLGVLATRRGAGVPSRLAAALPAERVYVSDLAPLAPDVLDRLIQVRLGVALRRPALRSIHETAAGNPLYSLELARASVRDSTRDTATASPLSATLAELIRNRVASVGRSTGEALLVVAAHPMPTVESVVEVLGPAARPALQHAVDAGLLEPQRHRLRFTHPLLASAVLRSADPHRRRRVHAQLGEMAGEAGDPEQRGRHLSAATVLADAPIALDIELGAAAAWRRGAPEGAAELAGRAADLTPADDLEGWVRRTTRAADYAWEAGDDARCCRHLASLVDRLPAGRSRAGVLRRLAMRESMSNSFTTARTLLNQGIDEAGHDTALRGLLHRDLAFALMQEGDVVAAQVPAAHAVACARETGDLETVADAETILLLQQVIGADDAAIEGDLPGRLEQAAVGETTDRWLPSGSRRVLVGAMLKWVDHFDAARATLTSVYRDRWERQEDGLLVPALFQLGELECWAGDFAEADRLGVLAEQTERRLPQRDTVRPMWRHVEALVAARRGDVERARELAEEQLALATATSDGRNRMRALSTLGFVALSTGRGADAVESLAAVDALEHRFGYRHPGVLRSTGDHIEALLAVGDRDAAGKRLRAFAFRTTISRSHWGRAVVLRCRGLLALAADDKSGSVGILPEAAAAARRQPDPFERGRTLLALGGALRRSRRRVEARTALHQARTVFEGLGAQQWRAKALAELEHAGDRQCRSGTLTPMQSTVADLVARGRSNKEIAAELFLSPKTIEAHLSVVYRQLGVRSRTELAASRSLPPDQGESPLPGRRSSP